MDERERRLAENERLFREVNERIEAAAVGHGVDNHMYAFVCECSNVDCTLTVTMPLAEYDRARQDPAVFVLAFGHELPEIEKVVHRGGGYQLVRKQGEAGRLARETDPRAP
ncbi:MAG: hypothetical protein KGI93_12660 [Acidobacteriota bacterium]|nr:hypothetical protein [Acidobacteriota bacterium]MDE3191206.1 hypothetical protein [Acidobacteriota bacterium]